MPPPYFDREDKEPTHAWPLLPGDWNPPGQFGHGPDDPTQYYPRGDATAVEMGSGKMNLDSAGNFMDPPAMDWYGENRPMQKTSWWPTNLGKKYRNEMFGEMHGVNMSGYPEDEFGGFVEDYGNPHADRFPWELEPEWTGETSPFFPPLTIGDYPTGEFGEEIIEEDNGSLDIWDFIKRLLPGGMGAQGIGTLLGNK
tara:strand:- start:43 stop:633 length:591 start_codon:yes stop_codon:yes gene_type:complete